MEKIARQRSTSFRLQTSFLLCLALSTITSSGSLSLRAATSQKGGPLGIVSSFVRSPLATSDGPLGSTILFVPTDCYSHSFSYTQRVTNTRATNLSDLESFSACFEDDFRSEDLLDVSSSLGPISLVGPESVLVRWNVTWTPPTASWLRRVANVWPGVRTRPTLYNHLSGQVSTFSWAAVVHLFRDAASTGLLKVPLACIEGRTLLRFARQQDATWVLESAIEDLSLADDLRREALRNRRCAADLRLFLERGRRPPSISVSEWAESVAECLPWSSVPGSGPLDYDPADDDEGSLPAVGFLFVVAMVITAFGYVAAPELLGQSLFGPFGMDPVDIAGLE